MHLAGEYGMVTVLFKAHIYFVNIAFTLLSHCMTASSRPSDHITTEGPYLDST